MAWFFTDDNINTNTYIITGDNANHIIKSLRMKANEEISLCSPDLKVHTCKITDITSNRVTVSILKSEFCEQEPNVKITLFQALTKKDKLDTIVQKSVELGVYKVVPFLSARCVSRPDPKSILKKVSRWQKIALSAAMQSRRGIIPEVVFGGSFDKAVQDLDQFDLAIIFYECGGNRVGEILSKGSGRTVKNIAVFIGSEGGFEQSEVEKILKSGGKCATLGKRILRAETAPLAALSVIMYETGNM